MLDMVSFTHRVCGIPERPLNPPNFIDREPDQHCRRCGCNSVSQHREDVRPCPDCHRACGFTYGDIDSPTGYGDVETQEIARCKACGWHGNPDDIEEVLRYVCATCKYVGEPV